MQVDANEDVLSINLNVNNLITFKDYESGLKFLDVHKEEKCEFIADTKHDNICILPGKRSNSNFETNLITYSKNNDGTLLEVTENFTTKYEYKYENDTDFENKKQNELFVFDVFNGNYQIIGINNFFDSTTNPKHDNIKDRKNKYSIDSTSIKFTNYLNCDKLLYSYYNNFNEALDVNTIDINFVINEFWKRLINYIKQILDNDNFKNFLTSNNEEIIRHAIEILKTLKFTFDTKSSILTLKNINDMGEYIDCLLYTSDAADE